tara:strand:+ start:51953 stop:52858 length:906 start_codon:yes stop_codon:yes gene_type:complete
MKVQNYKKLMGGSLLIVTMLIGCAGAPQNNPLLTEAEQVYSVAENDSLVVLKAPVALKEAEENLEKSQAIWKEKGDEKLVNHYAYMAKQKTAIAIETAKLNEAQDAVEGAESRRQVVLLTARRAEAIAAERKAKDALEEAREDRLAAEKAREEARNAEQKAIEMASRISELEAKQTERGLVLTLSEVLFDFNSAELKIGSKNVVEELTNFLNEYPMRKVLIEGYTDNIGSVEYNKTLSQQRANSLRNALVNNGVNTDKIETKGLGEQYPIATNINEAGRQQNRRVEIVVSDNEGIITQRKD